MTALAITHPRPEDWVSVEVLDDGASFAIQCSHCGEITGAYVTALRKDPALLEREVTRHNQCEPKER